MDKGRGRISAGRVDQWDDLQAERRNAGQDPQSDRVAMPEAGAGAGTEARLEPTQFPLSEINRRLAAAGMSPISQYDWDSADVAPRLARPKKSECGG